MVNVGEIVKATGGRLLKGSFSLGIKGISIDSRKINEGKLFIALKGKHFDGHNFLVKAVRGGAKAVLIENSFFKKNKNLLKRLPNNKACITVGETLKALGELASYHREKFLLPIVAITGSCGKTTTKDMLVNILSAHFRVLETRGTENNLIGVPLTLLRLRTTHEIACIEFGTNSFTEIERLTRIVRPTVAVIINIGEGHLQGLKTKGNVFKEKAKLLEGLRYPAVAIVNYDDPYLRTLNIPGKNIFGFGKKNKSDFFARDINFDKDRGISFRLKPTKQKFAIKTFGVHNIYNALAAIGVGIIFGIDKTTIAKGLANFKFPSSRFNLLKAENLTIIDDTYNANPLSLSYALESLKGLRPKGRKILVLADMLELGEKANFLHRKMGRFASSLDIDFIFTFGRLAGFSSLAALECGFDKDKVYSTQKLSYLKDKLKSRLKKGDCVLVKGSRLMRMERIINFLRMLKI